MNTLNRDNSQKKRGGFSNERERERERQGGGIKLTETKKFLEYLDKCNQIVKKHLFEPRERESKISGLIEVV